MQGTQEYADYCQKLSEYKFKTTIYKLLIDMGVAEMYLLTLVHIF